jgi:hypothetical protein
MHSGCLHQGLTEMHMVTLLCTCWVWAHNSFCLILTCVCAGGVTPWLHLVRVLLQVHCVAGLITALHTMPAPVHHSFVKQSSDVLGSEDCVVDAVCPLCAFVHTARCNDQGSSLFVISTASKAGRSQTLFIGIFHCTCSDATSCICTGALCIPCMQQISVLRWLAIWICRQTSLF